MDANLEGLVQLHELTEAWRVTGHGPRLRAVQSGALKLRERFAGGPRAMAVRTFSLTTLPYPTRYAFNGAATSVAPFVILTHRALLVQFLQRGAIKHLLFNPTDTVASRATPYFARLAETLPKAIEPLIVKKFDPLEEQLLALGVTPGDIDYVAFDHFHTQDLRGLLGTSDGARTARFPNARLIAQKAEWDDWDDLHPVQRAWFIEDGKKGVDTSRIVIVDGDVLLGDGVMLVRTPGHTSGNQTLFMNTEQGVWGTSECGTCADSWSPHESRISGLLALCRKQDLEVIVNSNTPELGADQYTSMLLERMIVDRVKAAPRFVQMFPSSEVTAHFIAPGVRPTWVHGAIETGRLAKSRVELGSHGNGGGRD